MTGPRRRTPPAGLAAFAIPSRDDELDEIPHPSTIRLATVTPIDEPRPTPRPAPPRTMPTEFVQIPLEILLDARLSDSAVRVWGWFAAQPQLWNGTRAAVSLRDCPLVGRTQRKAAVKELAAAVHLIVYPRPGQTSEYSLPWLAVHRMARRMKDPT